MPEKEILEWLVIVNPNAGVGKGRKDWKKISAILNSASLIFHSEFTEKPLHALQITIEKIHEGYRKIIVVGGDGTMNEVVNGIFKQNTTFTDEITLGMIPVGTGNDWGRTFGIPADYFKAVDIIKREQTMMQDAGLVKYYCRNEQNTRYFINMAGMGFDGLVAEKTNADKVKGSSNPVSYLKNLLTSLVAYKSADIRINVDGREIDEKIFSIGIGIGQYNGGGMQQAPDALPDDGLFDLVLIKDMSKWSVLTSVRRLYNGTIGKHKRVEIMTAKTVSIDSNPPVLLETDGESMGHSPFEFRIIPKSIKVIFNKQE